MLSLSLSVTNKMSRNSFEYRFPSLLGGSRMVFWEREMLLLHLLVHRGSLREFLLLHSLSVLLPGGRVYVAT